LLEGLGSAPPSDPALRAVLDAAALDELLRELAELDPVAYASIDCQNPRRVVRAVEVLRLTGRPYSEQRSDWSPKSEQATAEALFVLKRSSADLRQRIDSRVETMFRDGLVAETRQLLERGLRQNRTAMQALGYRQVVEHLEGVRSLEETIELVKTRTRQFAKRQMTWFRQQPNVNWTEVSPHDSTQQLADFLLTHYASRITSITSPRA
jgi:tRNA dimethylallyltransferase